MRTEVIILWCIMIQVDMIITPLSKMFWIIFISILIIIRSKYLALTIHGIVSNILLEDKVFLENKLMRPTVIC